MDDIPEHQTPISITEQIAPTGQSVPISRSTAQNAGIAEQTVQATQQAEPPCSSLEQDIRKGEKWGIAIGGLSLVVSTLIAVIYLHQLREMKKATEAAQLAAFEACLGAQVSRSTLLEMERGADDNHSVAVATVSQALLATESERAKVTHTPFKEAYDPNQSLGFSFNFKNTGKTAAKNVRALTRVEIFSRESDPEFRYPAGQVSDVRQSILEGGEEMAKGTELKTIVLTADGHPFIPKQADIDDFKFGRKDMLVYGVITYTDIFGVAHFEKFCRVSQTLQFDKLMSTGHLKCHEYDSVDTNSIVPKPQNATQKSTTPPEISCTAPATNSAPK